MTSREDVNVEQPPTEGSLIKAASCETLTTTKRAVKKIRKDGDSDGVKDNDDDHDNDNLKVDETKV